MACSPLAAYLGTQGDCLPLALRPGTQHSVFETPYDLEPLLPLAQRLCAAPLLVSADSGFCGEPILAIVAQQARALTEGTLDKHGKPLPIPHYVLVGWTTTLPVPANRTVMQEMIVKAARLIRHAGCWVLSSGKHDNGAEVFIQHDGQLVTT
jgi:hypothetical protein